MRRRPILPLLLVVLALTLACTERGSLPTGPAQPEATSEWRLDYPLLANFSLVAVWGMDADDMWAVGGRGVILHFDGERCVRVASPTTREIRSIHGRARDDAWAVSRYEILHWDGRSWTVAKPDEDDLQYRAIWCADDGDIYASGRRRIDDDWFPCVLRHDGAVWRDTYLPPAEDGDAGGLWQPGPGSPVLLEVGTRLYRFGNGRWTPVANQIDLRDFDGALAVGRLPGLDDQFLFRFDAAGEPYVACPEETLTSVWRWVDDLADARSTILMSYTAGAIIRDCGITALENLTSGGLIDLTVPELLRPDGSVIFGVGYDGLFLRGALTGTDVAWRILVPEPRVPLGSSITGTCDLLFGSAYGHRLLVREHGIWRAESCDEIPYDPDLQLLPDGRLVAWQGRTIVVRRPDATWYVLPELPEYMQSLWTDGDDDGVAYTNRGTEWTLAGGNWAQTDSLGERIRDLQGRGDEVYRLTDSQVLERRAGDHWEHVFGDEDDRVSEFYLSPWSDDIYVFAGVSGQGSGTYVLRYGSLVAAAEDDDFVWRSERVCEARPGDFYQVANGVLHRLADGVWQSLSVEGPTRDLDRVWGHPDQGLFVLDYDGQLFHRPFPGTGD